MYNIHVNGYTLEVRSNISVSLFLISVVNGKGEWSQPPPDGWSCCSGFSNCPHQFWLNNNSNSVVPHPLALSLPLSMGRYLLRENIGRYHSWRESGFSTKLTDPQINTCLWMCSYLPSYNPPSAGGAHFVMLNMAVSQEDQGRKQAWGPRKDWTRNTQIRRGEEGRKKGLSEERVERDREKGMDTGVQLLVGWSYRLRRSQNAAVCHSVIMFLMERLIFESGRTFLT